LRKRRQRRDAQHIAAELVGCYEKQRRSWPAIALTTDTSALTAVSNDLGYEQVFARQVRGLRTAGDVLIAISTSGKSKNVCERRKRQGNRLQDDRSDRRHCGSARITLRLAVAVPATRTSRIQEAHITIGHLWCEMVDQIE
jgi:D-sedoheptulose 7-phosphate isomerase